MKKGHSKLSENEPENILKLVFDKKRQLNW